MTSGNLQVNTLLLFFFSGSSFTDDFSRIGVAVGFPPKKLLISCPFGPSFSLGGMLLDSKELQITEVMVADLSIFEIAEEIEFLFVRGLSLSISGSQTSMRDAIFKKRVRDRIAIAGTCPPP